MRVALYIRVSTEDQARHGVSVEAQTAALRAWATQENMQVVGEYIDAGLSARKPASKRPELQRLLADVKAGKVQLIAFTKLDRWFRNIAEYYKVQEILEAHNTSWRAIHEDYETVTASGRLKVNIMLAVNQDEADRDSERIRAVFDRKKELGEVISGSVPLGYKIENKKYAIDEATADMARDMFSVFMETRSAYATQRYMLKTYGYKRDVTTVKRMLESPMYKGEKYGQKDYCPALITPAQHDAVVEILSERAARNSSKPAGRIYIFKGLVRCAECRHIHTGVCGKGHHYYRCAERVFVGTCQNKKLMREDKIEAYLIEHIIQKCRDYNIEVERQRKAQPKNDEALLRRKMIKLKDLYLNDLIEKADYERDFLAIRAQLEAIDKTKEIVQEPIDIDKMQDALDMYSTMDSTEKRAFWSLIIKEIVVSNGQILSFTLRNI